MRPAQSLMQLAVCLSSLAPLALASAWPGWLPDIDAIVVRADSQSSSARSLANIHAAATQDPTSASDSASGTPTPDSTGTSSGKPAPQSTVDLNTAEPSKTGKATGTNTKNGTSKATHTEFAPDSPVGGVQILTPATNVEPTVLYKIKDQVTWGWNYTSLQGTPTAIDVLVSCSSASATWTLTSNMTFATSVNYVWDTKKQADDPEAPLLTEMYTLIVKDSDSAITAAPEAGYLGVYSGFKFGLYTAQPYTPYPEWTCPGCSDASSFFSHQPLGLAVTMSVVTFFSFTWFVAGLELH
ncbi:hypothetical protein TOPH_02529 [Tolypocladium ophioglossoides CBS 100239]|uniref:DUF7137 domain-containing protein n=1 Tax=Tolypocladium ophioglossoides (strain CBS 100239) TaxID=1163406 RepID=A0A0L0NEL7_TOLOC|nr:hypothetical protein TOPH_02529 [Tolypocladium ophioglossoides CBS 100239]